MTERIPRQLVVHDHLDMAEHFDYNISVDPEVAAARRDERGKGTNIINDQSAGIDVGTRVLTSLDPELRKEWAPLFGGTLLDSALYTLRDTDEEPMTRNFKYIRLVDEHGVWTDDEERRAKTLELLKSTQDSSEKVEAKQAERKLTGRDINDLGHLLGNTSTLVSIFAMEFSEDEGELSVMKRVHQQNLAVQRAMEQLTLRLRSNPSVAQLRTDTSPLGADIIRSKRIPLEIKTTFQNVLSEVSHPLGY